MRLPDFAVIGAMKSATTSLCDILAKNSGVFICSPKEPEFLCREALYSQGKQAYSKLFEGAKADQICGEGSTSYTKCHLFPGVAARMADWMPHLKLIYIMRDPVKRIESHWMHTVRSGDLTTRFPEAVLGASNHYVETSLYWKQISEFRRYFSDDQILLLFYEDFQRSPEAVVSACLRFLDVSDATVDPSAATARHVSLGSRVDRPIVKSLMNTTLLKAAFQCLPRSVRSALKRPFQVTLDQRPHWTEPALSEVLTSVQHDAHQILEFAGKPPDFWSLTAQDYLSFS